MSRPPSFRRYLRFWGPDVGADIDDEFAFHFDMRVAEYVHRGLPPDEAHRRVAAEFGDVATAKRECRDIGERALRRRTMRTRFDTIAGDLRFAVRSLRRTPGFLAATVATLAIGIGATTAIFTVVHGVLLRPLPYPDPDRIVQVWQVGDDGGQMNFSDANFVDVERQARSFDALAQFTPGSVVSVSGPSEPVRAWMSVVSRDFFRVLGVRAVRGRTFAPEELVEGGAAAVVVSHAFWQRELGGADDAIGRRLTFDGTAFTVVGIAEPKLGFPAGFDLFVARERSARNPYRTGHNWRVIGRVKQGLTVAQAQSDASAVARALKRQYGSDTHMADAALVPLHEQLVGGTRKVLLVLLGASALLLLIAIANVVNLLLARMATRRGEMAVRLAIGAGRLRLMGQLVTESLVLSLGAGVLGVALAGLGVRALLALQPGDLPRVDDVRVSLPVLAFALGVSVATAVALALFAAFRGASGELRAVLAEGQRTQGAGTASHRVRSSLVVGQVALAVVLLVGAGLMARTLLALFEVQPGFRTERVLVTDLSLPWAETPEDRAANVRFFEDVVERTRALPGVMAAGAVNALPLAVERQSNGGFIIMRDADEQMRIEDLIRLSQDTSRTGYAEFRWASEGYFRAMDIPLLRGRLFEARDAESAPHVAVISKALADARWPGQDPLGRVIQFGNMDGDMRPFTIVGVVGDVRESSLDGKPQPMFYASWRQRTRGAFALHVVARSDGDPAALAAAMRRIVRDLRPDVPPRIRTIETVVAGSVADRRFVLVLLGTFGLAALVLASLGVYGVIAYLVAQRRREIGIRVALGAAAGAVQGMVLRQGLALAGVGVVAGVAASLLAVRLMAAFLYGVRGTDPVALAGAVVALGAVALVASWLPARRAARVEPAEVLRS